MGWGESDSSGAWIKFQVMPEDLDRFRGLKGQCFAMVLAMMDSEPQEDPEKEPEKPKGGKHSRDAALVCQQVEFQRFAYRQQAKILGADLPGWDTDEGKENSAADFLRGYCGIKSRAELDNNHVAFNKFQELMAAYNKTLKG